MEQSPKVVGLEMIVRRIDSVVDVFVEAFGWGVVYDGPSSEVPGRAVVVDAGSIAITLLQPDDSGAGILGDRAPRLSQIVVGGNRAHDVIDRLTALGLPTHGAGPNRRFVPPEAVEGILGFETALMIQHLEEDQTPSIPATAHEVEER